jgi:hypothetical protein
MRADYRARLGRRRAAHDAQLWEEGGKTPGHASSSPFNEPTETEPGGTGGENYNEKSQYDVACYQISTAH